MITIAELIASHARNTRFVYLDAPAILDGLTPVQVAVEAYRKAAGDARANPHLSAEGKAAAAREAATKAVTQIEAWRTTQVAGMNGNVAARRATLIGQQGPLDAPRVDAMSRRLASFTPDEVALLYRTSTPDEQRAIEAIHVLSRVPERTEHGVRWRPLLDERVISEVTAERIRAISPPAADAIAEIEEARDIYAGVASVAIAEIKASEADAFQRATGADPLRSAS